MALMRKRYPLTGYALITGATSGIGFAFACALAVRKVNIVLVARNEERLKKTQEYLIRSYGIECEILQADVSRDDGLQCIQTRLTSAHNPISIFINNAGHGLHHKLATTDTEPLVHAMDVMAKAPVLLGAHAGNAMKERGNGIIINTASISGLVPMGLYSAIKSLVRTWSLSLGFELKNTGVRVITFMPGWVHTEHHKRAGITTSNIPSWLFITAQRAANECLEKCEKGRWYVVPSHRFQVMEKLALHTPISIVGAITQKIKKGRDAAQH
ncbi:MAG: SDR family NAD(P)-dependent oxidoreductase [Actinomycetaceae bacterium]|nr:SDR family NAD(P)-dependent oxidoreductase [Actinomycetaceae bacterium]